MTNKQLFYSELNSNKLTPFTNKQLSQILKEKYNFQVGFIPQGYDVAHLLLKEDATDSFKDEWVNVFFKKVVPSQGTITLDNIEDLEDSDETYRIYKEIPGSFESVIEISCDLIRKHKEVVQHHAN